MSHLKEYNRLSSDRSLYRQLGNSWNKKSLTQKDIYNKGERWHLLNCANTIGKYQHFNQTFNSPLTTPAGSFLAGKSGTPSRPPNLRCYPFQCPAGMDNYSYNTIGTAWKKKRKYQS